MKRYFQINNEKFRCEPQARHRLEELKLTSRQAEEHTAIELWEVTQEQDIFGDTRTVKQLVTKYTPNLPNNGIFRIHDAFDIRRSKKMYSMQKYDSANQCWKNFKTGDDLGLLTQFMMIYSEVK